MTTHDAATPARPAMSAQDMETSLANLKLERDAVALYERLAAIEPDPRRSGAFRAIAANERRHADIWARRLRDAGANVPDVGAPRLRVRVILALARVFGTRSVSDLVKSLEGDEEDAYADQSLPEVAAIAADEREHAEIWKRLDAGARDPLDGDAATADGPALMGPPSGAFPVSASSSPTAVAASRGRDEAWHRASRGGTLRAGIFGINDGLVSNLSLVMGVTGASADNHIIVLAGIAGLLAGAFSMAAGEYISMQSQRELFQRQIGLEREEMRVMPEVEERELANIYRAKGLSESEAALIARRLMADPAVALDTKVREELGLDPNDLGSPWGAAGSSFVSFGVGALIPLAPYLLTTGSTAIVAALALAFGALFLVGAGVSLLTGRGALYSGARQVGIGAAAAAVTFAVGTLIGVRVGG